MTRRTGRRIVLLVAFTIGLPVTVVAAGTGLLVWLADWILDQFGVN